MYRKVKLIRRQQETLRVEGVCIDTRLIIPTIPHVTWISNQRHYSSSSSSFLLDAFSKVRSLANVNKSTLHSRYSYRDILIHISKWEGHIDLWRSLVRDADCRLVLTPQTPLVAKSYPQESDVGMYFLSIGTYKRVCNASYKRRERERRNVVLAVVDDCGNVCFRFGVRQVYWHTSVPKEWICLEKVWFRRRRN